MLTQQRKRMSKARARRGKQYNSLLRSFCPLPVQGTNGCEDSEGGEDGEGGRNPVHRARRWSWLGPAARRAPPPAVCAPEQSCKIYDHCAEAHDVWVDSVMRQYMQDMPRGVRSLYCTGEKTGVGVEVSISLSQPSYNCASLCMMVTRGVYVSFEVRSWLRPSAVSGQPPTAVLHEALTASRVLHCRIK